MAFKLCGTAVDCAAAFGETVPGVGNTVKLPVKSAPVGKTRGRKRLSELKLGSECASDFVNRAPVGELNFRGEFLQ